MKVEVRMFSDFRKYLPEEAEKDQCCIEIENGSSLWKLLDNLGIPNQKPRVITVNDTNHREDYILKDADVVKVFPLAKGG